MGDLGRALSTEWLKLRRTLALWMVFVAPVLVVSLQFFIGYDRMKLPENMQAWPMFVQSSVAIWAVFMLPLFITLETALLNNLEHTAKAWKQLFALPPSRWSIMTAKMLTGFLLIGISTIVLGVSIVLFGKLLSMLRPQFLMEGIPLALIVQKTFFPFIASWLIIAIHSWISARWAGYALSLGIGIGAVFFAVFASGARLGAYYPWLFPLNALGDERSTIALIVGSLGGILFAVFGTWDITRRDVL